MKLLLTVLAVSCSCPLTSWAFEVDATQEEAGSGERLFRFTGAVDGLRIEHRQAYFGCCLELAPNVEVEDGVVRVQEIDAGPPCLCPVIPWNLTITISELASGPYDVYLTRHDGELLATAHVSIPDTETMLFRRGRINDDDSLDIADAVAAIEFLFGDGRSPACLDALDVNDDGDGNIADAIYLLNFLFGGGEPPLPPFAAEGEDPTEDDIVCSLTNTVVHSNFKRSYDFNGDGSVDLTDRIFFLSVLLEGRTEGVCLDALDTNDDGMVSLADNPIPPLPGPFSIDTPPAEPTECGVDPTPDALSCAPSGCE